MYFFFRICRSQKKRFWWIISTSKYLSFPTIGRSSSLGHIFLVFSRPFTPPPILRDEPIVSRQHFISFPARSIGVSTIPGIPGAIPVVMRYCACSIN